MCLCVYCSKRREKEKDKKGGGGAGGAVEVEAEETPPPAEEVPVPFVLPGDSNLMKYIDEVNDKVAPLPTTRDQAMALGV